MKQDIHAKKKKKKSYKTKILEEQLRLVCFWSHPSCRFWGKIMLIYCRNNLIKCLNS